MTIQEAIQQCGPDDWIRPVTWRGTGCAILVDSIGLPGCVPGPRGEYMYQPRTEEILADWEVVTFHVVHQEIRALQEEACRPSKR